MKNLVLLYVFLCSIIVEKVYAQHFQAEVIQIVDGDTLYVSYNHEKIKIRLYGIDAPEMKQKYGKQSKDFLESLLSYEIITVCPLGKDRYQGIIAMVYFKQENIQALLIENGLAWVYPKYCRKNICKNWEILEKNARDNKKALWGDKNFIAPWEWRK